MRRRDLTDLRAKHAFDAGHRRADTPPRPDHEVRELVVHDPGRVRRITGMVLYLFLFGIVAAGVVWMFEKLTGNLLVAGGLVAFMATYMLVTARLASLTSPAGRGGGGGGGLG